MGDHVGYPGDTTCNPVDAASLDMAEHVDGPPPPAKPIPGQEDVGRPSVRELFRNTVEVADVDPPRMEFRVRVQRAWQDHNSATVEYLTESKPMALVEMKYLKRVYPEGHVWLEQRPVTAWTEAE